MTTIDIHLIQSDSRQETIKWMKEEAVYNFVGFWGVYEWMKKKKNVLFYIMNHNDMYDGKGNWIESITMGWWVVLMVGCVDGGLRVASVLPSSNNQYEYIFHMILYLQAKATI